MFMLSIPYVPPSFSLTADIIYRLIHTCMGRYYVSRYVCRYICLQKEACHVIMGDELRKSHWVSDTPGLPTKQLK